MAQLSRKAGRTSNVLLVFIQDSTSSTGEGLAGLAYGTGGLTCYYKRNTGAASVAVTLADITTLGTFVAGGFKAVDGTNSPGLYEFHPPDAALASGADSVAFFFRGAAGMGDEPLLIELTGTDNQDAQRGGMAALPASGTLLVKPAVTLATADVTGNLPANAVQFAGQAITASAGVTLPASVASQSVAPSWYVSIPIAATGIVKASPAPSTTEFTLESVAGSRFAARKTLFIDSLAGEPVRVVSITPSGDDWAVVVTPALSAAPAAGDVAIIPGQPATAAADDTPGTATLVSRVTGNVALAGSAPSWLVSASSIADAVFDEAVAGHTDAGTFGLLFTSMLNAAVGSRSTFNPASTGVKLAADGTDLVMVGGVRLAWAMAFAYSMAAGLIDAPAAGVAGTATLSLPDGTVIATFTVDGSGSRSAVVLADDPGSGG